MSSNNFIVPFMYQPYSSGGEPPEPYQVWAVNESNPENTHGFLQGYWECTHCGKGNQFRFYDEGPDYQAHCPDCQKDFMATEPEWEDEEEYEDRY